MSATALGLLALLIVGGTGFRWFRAMRRVQLPKNRSGFLTVLFGGGALGVIALAESPGWIGGVSAVLAIIIGALFCATAAISRQKRLRADGGNLRKGGRRIVPEGLLANIRGARSNPTSCERGRFITVF